MSEPRLPLWCRLRGHGRLTPMYGSRIRKCRRCDVPDFWDWRK